MRLFRSVFTIAFYTSISRILGFIRDIFIARYLGVSTLSDVFFAAFKLPNFFRRIFAEGAFNSAFVPIFVDKLQVQHNRREALLFVRNILSFLFYALLIFIIILQIFMPLAMKFMFFGFSSNPEKFNLLVNLSRITIFYLLFIAIVSLFSAILNSIEKFAIPSAVPIILNGTLIASLFIFDSITPNLAYALSWGVFAAGILQLLWLGIFLIKHKVLVYPTIPKVNKDAKYFFKKLVPGVIGANVMQLNLLVDTMIASIITGAISYLYYADRINQLPLAMIGIAINIALLPALSKKIKSGNIKQAIKMQNLALEAGLFLVIPAALGLFALATPIIDTLFARGEFGTGETFLVAKALQYYAFGLPAFVMVKVLEPAFFSRGNTSLPMRIALFCLGTNIVLNIVFIAPFGYVGIILASVIASYLNVALMLYHLIKKDHFAFEKKFLSQLIKILVPAIFMAFIATFLNGLLSAYGYHKIFNLITTISVSFLIYITLSYLLGSLKFLKYKIPE